jgi:hypothetical protein
MFLWTHYYAESLLSTRHREQFVEENNVTQTRFGDAYVLHWRTYGLEGFKNGVPLHYEGGQQSYSFWMERGDIIRMLTAMGFRSIRVGTDAKLNDMPVLSLFAERPQHTLGSQPT